MSGVSYLMPHRISLSTVQKASFQADSLGTEVDFVEIIFADLRRKLLGIISDLVEENNVLKNLLMQKEWCIDIEFCDDKKAEMEMVSLLCLPNEILLFITYHLEVNSLLSLRVTAHRLAAIVENVFHTRSYIKMPLACFSLHGQKYPFPYTASYFLRKRLWQTKDATPSMAAVFLKCADFSHQWNYIGEELFRTYVNLSLYVNENPASNLEAQRAVRSLCQFWENLKGNKEDNPDIREMMLWCFTFILRQNLSGDVNASAKLNGLAKCCVNHVNSMPVIERKNIACFYMNSNASYLSDIKQHAAAETCYGFSAAQGDPVARKLSWN